jgi:exodeoxyribonuclease VII small subunit
MTDESPRASNSHQPTSFEEGLARLGDIVARLESGSLGLSESIAAYENGVMVLRELHTELASVEERVSKLVKIDDEGRPILEPLATENPPAPPPQSGRKPQSRPLGTARRRSNVLPGMDDAREDA